MNHSADKRSPRVAAVLPCYKSKRHLPSVIERFGPEVERIYVVDDACPEGTVKALLETCADPRVTPIFLPENRGVGGAVLAGYRQALDDGFDIMVKVDSDGQMDPRFIPALIAPILREKADYTKGNRFFNISDAASMPKVRFVGNFFLSFLTKASSGYWSVFDPTNGFTAIHRTALKLLKLEKIETRYFFESDMLFRLGTVEAVVQDAPMVAKYGEEVSGLNAGQELVRFGGKHITRFFKRIGYKYFLRGMSGGTLFLILFIILFLISAIYSAALISQSLVTGIPSSPGEAVLGAALFLLAIQMAVAFLVIDMQPYSGEPLQLRSIEFLEEPKSAADQVNDHTGSHS